MAIEDKLEAERRALDALRTQRRSRKQTELVGAPK